MNEWTPIRVQWQGKIPSLQWARLGHVDHAKPFFSESILHAIGQFRMPIEQRTTPLADLKIAAGQSPLPTGFIFHLSRCGSTLAAQLLSKLDGATVISEAPPIDSVLRAHLHNPSISDDQRIDWLRGMLWALRSSSAGQRHFFIKFDAWHTLELPLIQRAFPDVPWIFLCRNPLEVMRSHARQPGSHMIQGPVEPEVYGWTSPMRYLSASDYGASVLIRICESAHDAIVNSSNGRVLDYTRLPQAISEMVLPFFKINANLEEIDRICDTSRLDAKNPSTAFASKIRTESPVPASDLEQRLWQAYEQLLKTCP